MVRVRSLGFLLVCVFGVLSCLGQRVWHHPSSPFRAVFELKQTSNHGRGGTVLEVPICGVGSADGRDVHCYDGESGRPLLREHLGRSSQERSLVLVRPESDTRVIQAYFGSGIPGPRHEFIRPVICEVRSLPEGPCHSRVQAERLLKSSRLIGRVPLDRVCQVANPLSEDRTFIMVFEGSFLVRKPETKTLFVACSNPAYLYVDGEIFLECNNVRNHWGTLRGERRQSLTLKPGVHPFKLVAFCLKGSRRFVAALGKCRMSGKQVKGVDFVSGNELVQGGDCVLKRVEGKSRRSSVPQFWYRHVSYMSAEDIGYITETELGTYSGQVATWRFGDGCEMKGAKVTRLFGQLDAVSVTATVKREQATGKVMFSMVAPRQRRPGNRRDFAHYADIMEKQGVEKLTDGDGMEPLLGLLSYHDNHPLLVPLGLAYLGCRNSRGSMRLLAMKGVARAGSQGGRGSRWLKEAQQAYVNLMKADGLDRSERGFWVEEAIEFAVFGLRDLALGKRWLQLYGGCLKSRQRTSILMDLALQSGDVSAAMREYGTLLSGRKFGAEQRFTAVQGSFLGEEAGRAISEGRVLACRKALSSWSQESPMDRGNGSFSLIRARYFVGRGWLEGAEGELRGVLKADPELPNLPEVEFELGKVLRAQGHRKEARALFKRVNERYPNHPVAEEAGRLAR